MTGYIFETSLVTAVFAFVTFIIIYMLKINYGLKKIISKANKLSPHTLN